VNRQYNSDEDARRELLEAQERLDRARQQQVRATTAATLTRESADQLQTEQKESERDRGIQKIQTDLEGLGKKPTSMALSL